MLPVEGDQDKEILRSDGNPGNQGPDWRVICRA